jgi:hypothetical protein
MKNRFKPNDFIGILIAIALIALGFILLFIHEQSSQDAEQTYIEFPGGKQIIQAASSSVERQA